MRERIHSQISTAQSIEFVNWLVILSHTLFGMLVLIHAGSKAKPWAPVGVEQTTCSSGHVFFLHISIYIFVVTDDALNITRYDIAC